MQHLKEILFDAPYGRVPITPEIDLTMSQISRAPIHNGTMEERVVQLAVRAKYVINPDVIENTAGGLAFAKDFAVKQVLRELYRDVREINEDAINALLSRDYPKAVEKMHDLKKIFEGY